MTGKEKFRKVMKEFYDGKLTSNGKKVTDKDQAVAIAFSESGGNKNKLYAESYQDGQKLTGPSHEEGGIPAVMNGKDIELENNEQIINAASGEIRDIIRCEGTGFGIGSALNRLRSDVGWSDEGECKIIKEGKMKKGKKIKSYIHGNRIEKMIADDNESRASAQEGIKVDEPQPQPPQQFIKINEARDFHLLEILSGNNFNDSRILEHNSISIYSDNKELTDFLDKYGIHYTVFENRQELDDWIRPIVASRIKENRE